MRATSKNPAAVATASGAGDFDFADRGSIPKKCSTRKPRALAERSRPLTPDACIYVDEHRDDDEREFFSVNGLDGDGGFQFGKFSTRRAALLVAHILAREFGCTVRP
jgi:hypothetical protein